MHGFGVPGRFLTWHYVALQVRTDSFIVSAVWDESSIPARHLYLALNRAGIVTSRTVSGKPLNPLLNAIILKRVILLPTHHLEVTYPIMTSSKR